MSTIIIKPRNKSEEALLTKMLKKMNVDIQLVQESIPNYETQKAIEDAESSKVIKVKNAQDLFNKIGI